MAVPTISQRIALEGADEIIRQLQTLGDSGRKAIDQLSQAAQASQSPLSGISAAMDKLGAAAKDAGTKLSTALGGIKDHLPGLQTLGTVLGVTLTASLTGVVAGLVAFVSGAASAAAAAGRSAQQVGMSVEAYQALKFAAEAAGVESDKFQMAMFRFGTSVETAVKAQQKAAAGLASELVTNLGKGGAILQGLAGGFVQMVNAGKDVGNVVQPLRLTSDQMAQLRLAAAQVQEVFAGAGAKGSLDQFVRQLLEAGQSSEKVREQLRQLGVDFPAKTLEEAVKRTADTTVDKFSKMGIAIKKFDEDGKLVMRSEEEIFGDFAEKVSTMTSETQKLDAASDVFSKRAARQLLPLLNEGRSGVEHLIEEYKSLGITFDGIQTKIGRDQVRAWHEFEAAIAGARNQVGIAFSPAITEVLREFTDIIRQNIPALKEWAATFGGEVNQAVKDFIFILRGGQGPVQNEWIRDWISGLGEFGSIAGAIFRFVGSEIGALARDIQTIKAEFQAIPGWLQSTSISDAISAWLASTSISDWFATQWERARGAAQDAWSGIVGIVQGALGSMLDSVTSWVQSVIDKISSIAAAIAGAFAGAAASGLPAIDDTGGLGQLPGGAGGGFFRGHGSTTSDSNLVRVSDREYIVNARATALYLPLLHAINSLRLPRDFLRGFSLGGLVDGLLPPTPGFARGGPVLAPASGVGSRVLNLTIDGTRFTGLVAPAHTFDALVRYSVARQTSAAGRNPSWVR
jgi:hypothetical protein